MKIINVMDYLALAHVIIGGLNWGLVGLFHWDLVAALFGPSSVLSRLTYIGVGVSAVYCLYSIIKTLQAHRLKGRHG